MPINIIRQTNEKSEKLAWICDEEWELPAQIEAQESWLLEDEVSLTVGTDGSSNSGCCLESWMPRFEASQVDAAQEVEEPAEVPTGPDHRWLQPVGSPTDLRQDEQMAIGDQERGVFRQEPSMVQGRGAPFPA